MTAREHAETLWLNLLDLGPRRLAALAMVAVTMMALIVQSSLSLSVAILLESALSFLGLGVQPPNPSWGNMLSSSRKVMILAPWTAIYPGLAIVVLVLGFNLLGDGLRDIMDPRLRNIQ